MKNLSDYKAMSGKWARSIAGDTVARIDDAHMVISGNMSQIQIRLRTAFGSAMTVSAYQLDNYWEMQP